MAFQRSVDKKLSSVSGIFVTLLLRDSFHGEIFSYYSSPSGVTLLPIVQINLNVTCRYMSGMALVHR